MELPRSLLDGPSRKYIKHSVHNLRYDQISVFCLDTGTFSYTKIVTTYMAIAEIFQINHSQSDHRCHMGICIILSSKSDCLASTSILSCSKTVREEAMMPYGKCHLLWQAQSFEAYRWLIVPKIYHTAKSMLINYCYTLL